MSGIIAQNVLDNSGLIKAPPGGGAWNFISKQTASSDSTIDFTSGIDSTYKEYLFTFNNIHAGTDGVQFKFQTSTDSGSSYGVTATTTIFRAYHNEAGNDTDLTYYDSDLAQSTDFQNLFLTLNTGNDESVAGYLHLFNPSSPTFAKHFIAKTTGYGQTVYNMQYYIAGYFNTTSPVDAIQFKMASGNIDFGDICLYGLTT